MEQGQKKPKKRGAMIALVIVALVIVAVVIVFIVGSFGDVHYVLSYEEREDGTYAVTGIEYQSGLGTIDTLEIPAEYNGKAVTEVRRFWGNFDEAIRSVAIADGIEIVSDEAFWFLPNLETLRLPSTLRQLGWLIASPDVRVEFAGNETYRFTDGCFVELETMTAVWGLDGCSVPDDIVAIGDNAFAWAQIGSFDLPQTLQTIGENAFARTTGLPEMLVISENIREVGGGAFYLSEGVRTLRLATRGRISFFAFEGIPLETLIIEITPNVFGNPTGNTTAIVISGENYQWLYVNETIDLSQIYSSEGALEELESKEVASDLAGYRKFAQD